MLFFRIVGYVGLIAALMSVFDALGGGICGQTCMEISRSEFSKLFGIPIGIFALPLWVLLLTASDRLKIAAASLLGIGAVIFLYIMRFVLDTYCPICVLHNACAIIAMLLLALCLVRNIRSVSIRTGAVLVLIFLAVCIFFFEMPKNKPVTLFHAAGQHTKINFPIVTNDIDNALVISLACPHCYVLLYEYLTYESENKELNIVIKTGQNTLTIAASILAAIYADYRKNGYENYYSSFQKVFLVVFKYSEEVQRGEYASLENELDLIAPARKEFVQFAEYVLESHAALSSRLGSDQTPIVIKNGSIILNRIFMSPDKFFGK